MSWKPKYHSVETDLLTGAQVVEYDYRSAYPKEFMTQNAPQSTPGPKHVPGRSHKETATAIRKDLIRQTGPLAGVRVEVRRTGQKSILATFTHYKPTSPEASVSGTVPVTAEWLASPAGQEAEVALRALLADYADGAPEPKGPKDAPRFSWVIASGVETS